MDAELLDELRAEYWEIEALLQAELDNLEKTWYNY
jgi:hypothetical protein